MLTRLHVRYGSATFRRPDVWTKDKLDFQTRDPVTETGRSRCNHYQSDCETMCKAASPTSRRMVSETERNSWESSATAASKSSDAQ